MKDKEWNKLARYYSAALLDTDEWDDTYMARSVRLKLRRMIERRGLEALKRHFRGFTWVVENCFILGEQWAA